MLFLLLWLCNSKWSRRNKEKVNEQRELLVTKYQDKVGDNEEKIKEINAAAERIFGL
jgi:hypothetical protein